jgi:hypothetical protein
MDQGEQHPLRREVERALEGVHVGSADYPWRVELATVHFPDVEVHLRASLRSEGLVIEGQDFGAYVEKIYGEDEIEYTNTVGWADVERVEELLREALGVDAGASVLELLKLAFDEGVFQTNVGFRELLEANGIEVKTAVF